MTAEDHQLVTQGAWQVLWGKSSAAGVPNLLVQHLLDAAAVAELIWDHYLAHGLRSRIDACCGGQGRTLYALLCGWHDLGKASPAFQSKVPGLCGPVRAAGLTWLPLNERAMRWHHTLAGACIVRRVLLAAGWDPDSVAWIWPLIGGHHGRVPSSMRLRPPGTGDAQGRGLWEPVQESLMRYVASVLGVDVTCSFTLARPSRGVQLAVSGLIIMADWIASDDRHFGGVADIVGVSMAGARRRASNAWSQLGLQGGWSPTSLRPLTDPIGTRFNVPARPAQTALVTLAERMPAPGLLICEAPMGEGKTEAALAAAEVLARRFGADGVFVGMPTQATSDPMFTRVREWAGAVESGTQVGLLHGKRRFNREWQMLRDRVRFGAIDGYGCDDPYGAGDASALDTSPSEIPAEWFLGRKRGLLAPFAVGTIDQLLHAATRTSHVMLRQAGLAGRVVILDEVHAYDVYMSQFLHEALRWLADAGVPVVVLSATLPPAMRADLVRSYLAGAMQDRDVDLTGMPVSASYPSALAASHVEGGPWFDSVGSPGWRDSLPTSVEVCPESTDQSPDRVVELLRRELSEGGCALVIRNTVGRAQRLYRALRTEFGDNVVLLHARLTSAARAERTERLLRLLGAPSRAGAAGRSDRPDRFVVVATQLAEQSFDVDADLLVADLAPIDLLLQRVGRLHRHERSPAARPAGLRTPRVVVTGLSGLDGAVPCFPIGSSLIYGEYPLIRSAGLVLEAADGGGWSVPSDVPSLVQRGYGEEPIGPSRWADTATQAADEWRHSQERRRTNATQFLLAGPDRLGMETLAGLHERSTAELRDEDQVAAVVRDGDPSVEVVLVCRVDDRWATLSGRALGINGEAVSHDDIAEEVLASSVRLPAREELTRAALTELRPLPAWSSASDPWLRRTRALVLDEARTCELGGFRLVYDDDEGLLVERVRSTRSR